MAKSLHVTRVAALAPLHLFGPWAEIFGNLSKVQEALTDIIGVDLVM